MALPIHQEHIDGLCPELRVILDAELTAGNTFAETRTDPRFADRIFIQLVEPFLTQWPTPPADVSYHDMSGRHFWKAHYRHDPTGHILACGFGGASVSPATPTP